MVIITKNVEAFVPNHTTGYGLSKAVIEEYANSGVSLIITVDCGISNAEEVEFARDLSIDIIVTDHHDIPEILPNAYAVFNPKISNTGFVSKNFSGCAVAFKLMQAFVFSYTKLYNKDIIVLDYEIDKSKNVLKRIRALNIDSKIIVVTSYANKGVLMEFLKLKVDGYVVKPVQRQTVIEHLAKVLGREDYIK